ncbi:hypothetical protein JCM21714_4132 [Gracilibacillus boraciitolerans JCM 21714]|uniref:Uncharacterized protein n=1 Tax=Gracilibacillus boraciitolerans JCM 21714 TaxID=1298598 RepID=W4VP09_9BACI|nr:hypothetical protein [Gracilibacillus boraciitolerans]GAE94932.1 hypothetical protein JCM21714_4132 [Gracilibacillus boraciitolerans JCM 21714]
MKWGGFYGRLRRDKRTNNKLSVLFPLKEHPVHGKTGLHATEKYKNGFVAEYHYQWKIIIPKMGKLYHHISAWENEPHDASWTREKFKIKSESHHHHHVPGDREQRKENWDTLTLDDAFSFVAHYIHSGEEYKP